MKALSAEYWANGKETTLEQTAWEKGAAVARLYKDMGRSSVPPGHVRKWGKEAIAGFVAEFSVES
jgi:hypothetical protein